MCGAFAGGVEIVVIAELARNMRSVPDRAGRRLECSPKHPVASPVRSGTVTRYELWPPHRGRIRSPSFPPTKPLPRSRNSPKLRSAVVAAETIEDPRRDVTMQ